MKHSDQFCTYFRLSSGETKPEDTLPVKQGPNIYPVFGGNGVLGYSTRYNHKGRTVVIGRVGEKCGCIHIVHEPAWISDNALYTKGLEDNDEYLFWGYLLSHVDLSRLRNKGGQPLVSQKPILSLKHYIPSEGERKKIAEILGACDVAIEAQERLIAQKQKRKKGLMQQLLTGKVRFPEFAGTGEWKEFSLGSLLKEVKRSVNWDDNEQYQLLSLRRRSGGPFARESLYGSQIKTKNLKTVHSGDFLIAKMQVTHGALGLVTPEFHEYKVSDSYICMVPRKPAEFDIRFLNYLSQNRYIWHLAYVSSYGVAIEKMTFVPKDFLKKEITIPPTRDECSAISDFIDTLNNEITLQQSKLEQLKVQKKGLMQKLLTGKVRVKT